MDIFSVIFVIVFCAIASFFIYGMYLIDNDRHEYRKKHGVDPKYHGWRLDKNDKDGKNQDK
jgi:hypothetical protein